MTDQELTVLMGFLTSGVLLGIIGHWIDQLAAYIRR